NNIQIVDNVTSDNQRWSISYNAGDFIFENLAVSGRILQYNASSPRFAAYTSNQVKLHLYKWVEVNDPVLTASPLDIDGLDYTVGSGPSVSESFDLSGLNMDGSNVTVSVDINSDFELSDDDVTFSNSVTLTAFDGTSTPLYPRLKAGLAIYNYKGVVDGAGGGAATAITVDLSGSVTPDYDGMETFENLPETSSSYASGSFAGVNG